MIILFIVVILLGLYMAWSIGANDFANSFGDAVGSRAISILWAVILGTICELAGSVLVGMYVSDTLRKEIVRPQQFVALTGLEPGQAAALFALGMACALLGAAIWNHVATWLALPVSTTHAIVGAVTGFGVVAAGWSVVDWHRMGGIVLSWFVSPIAGGVASYFLFKLITWFILGRPAPVRAAMKYAPVVVFLVALVVLLSILYKGHLLEAMGVNWKWLLGRRVLLVIFAASFAVAGLSKALIKRYLGVADGRPLAEQLHVVERFFAPLVVITSCSVAFSHGANDVANAIGPVAAVVDIARRGELQMSKFVPFWILGLGGLGIVIGLATYGRKVLRTIGFKITELTPSRGVAADLGTTATVLVCSRMGLPMSTTHTIVGAVVGIGLARGIGGVNRKIMTGIGWAWLLTVPAAALMTVVLFLLARLAGVDDMILRIIAPGAPAG